MTEHSRGSDVIADCAAALAQAELRRHPIEPVSEQVPGLTIAEAYGIQQANVVRRTQRGERIVGHKIGLTAKVMQELFGVHEPDFGHLLDTMVHDARQPLDLRELIDPQIEVEPAFILKRPLAGAGLTVEDVLAATDYLCVCFEVIDSRIVEWRIRIQDTVADNGSSARVVLGSQRFSPTALDLADLEATLELDRNVVARGNTSAILGHPANGVAWLASKLSSFGVGLKAGDVVLPGTCTRSCRIAGYSEVTGRIAGLGEITLQLANAPLYRRPQSN